MKKERRLLVLAMVALVCACLPLTSAAQQVGLQCGAHDDLSALLGDRYNEQRIGLGLIGQASLIELYVAESGSWTLLLTRTDRSSCIIAAGHSWESLPQPKGHPL